MKNRWNEADAARHGEDSSTGIRVYSSQLLGQDGDLVLHGGGNTSVKGELENLFGEREKVLFVKGSGWDLRTIEAAGFPPVSLDYLLKLGDLPNLSDSDMMKQLRLALLDPSAPTPSVEAILHALIPHKYVDHSHADAVVAISNTSDGERILAEIYGDEVLILPYVMPGFVLAQQVAAATRDVDWEKVRGIVLLHHGIFTFHEDPRTSYEAMIELVSKAENYLAEATDASSIATADYVPSLQECQRLSQLRSAAARLFGGPLLLTLDSSEEAVGFASLQDVAELATRGPLTPDHTIHAKAFAAVFADDPLSGLEEFAASYHQYFEEYAEQHHQILDVMPRYGVWKNRGMIYLAANQKRLGIVQDITRHTMKAIQWGEALGGWQALPREQLFEVEYWELEQAKLKTTSTRPEFEGKVAVVSGAASGIGKACVERLISRGAVVLALDISPDIEQMFSSASVLALRCDVTCNDEIEKALGRAVLAFGGIDILVSNAGNFPESQTLEEMDDANWENSMALNLGSHMKVMRAALPYLKHGLQPAVVFIASKNVPAPGPGAAAYSAAKAGLTQMARVAALELGAAGIRVNTLHPNAVYDTAIWTDDVLEKRAAHYGVSVQEYKTSNVLSTEVESADVAKAVVALAGSEFSKTTGAQLPVDGGNERVI